jgi:hypothetical protein
MLCETFLPFPLLHANDHSLAVDGVGLQVDHFRDAHARSVASGQDRAVLDALRTLEKLLDFLRTEDKWTACCFLGSGRTTPRVQLFFECYLIEPLWRKRSAGRRLCVSSPDTAFFLAGQIDLVRANLLRTQFSRRFTEVACEERDLLE